MYHLKATILGKKAELAYDPKTLDMELKLDNTKATENIADALTKAEIPFTVVNKLWKVGHAFNRINISGKNALHASEVLEFDAAVRNALDVADYELFQARVKPFTCYADAATSTRKPARISR